MLHSGLKVRLVLRLVLDPKQRHRLKQNLNSAEVMAAARLSEDQRLLNIFGVVETKLMDMNVILCIKYYWLLFVFGLDLNLDLGQYLIHCNCPLAELEARAGIVAGAKLETKVEAVLE
ncbi:NET1-associated nuclear protein 1 [Frankliniella fusca]|uniref:NET1-associated nuclear protein 1 n=1 Tax=Frankliniella fusca TaxID=407009 RepID=A0AAE1L935_9NEOP|nr:NET1-associated nuclear protein 1 [Frankliniella fusca]